MNSAERKRRWVERMRNADGSDMNSPRRMPVQVYLPDEARAVFGQMRALAKELGLPSLSNSELVERLLLALGQRTVQMEGVGYPVDGVLERYRRLKAEIAVLQTQLRLFREEPLRFGKRSLHKVLERVEAPPSREAIALEIKRVHNEVGIGAIEALARELAPLLSSRARDADFHQKLRRRIEAYMERLFGLGGT